MIQAKERGGGERSPRYTDFIVHPNVSFCRHKILYDKKVFSLLNGCLRGFSVFDMRSLSMIEDPPYFKNIFSFD